MDHGDPQDKEYRRVKSRLRKMVGTSHRFELHQLGCLRRTHRAPWNRYE